MSDRDFTAQARLDVDGIFNFIGPDNSKAAARWVDYLEEKCWMFADTAGVGRKRDELAPNLRSFPVGKHMIVYRPSENGIEVIRLLRGAMDNPAPFPG